MTVPAIKVAGLSKQYSVGLVRQPHSTLYDLLSHSITAPFRRARTLGALPPATEQFWALRDVNFEVQPGEVVGVIGRNGAGKSTLLKILSRITVPTCGRVTAHGRMASLLEVGTGFHPELSGRENIFLNGAILGMTRREVAGKFDEIVAFAEVDEFIDMPVKRYSSGMYVRLAFAIAAHLEPDVLLVDEVLAVGDSTFQRKSLGKMGDAAKGGKTVLFVSHNLAAMRHLCGRVLVLERGGLAYDGGAGEALAYYERSTSSPGGIVADAHFHGPLSAHLRFDVLVCQQGGEVVEVLDPLRPLQVELRGVASQSFPTLELKISLFRDGVFLASCHDTAHETGLREGPFVSRFDIPGDVLRPGRYAIGIGAAASVGTWLWGADAAFLDFSENWGGRSADRGAGIVTIPHRGQRIQ